MTVNAKSEQGPTPRIGAWMVIKGRYLYLIGGLTEYEQLVNEVWRFDLGT